MGPSCQVRCRPGGGGKPCQVLRGGDHGSRGCVAVGVEDPGVDGEPGGRPASWDEPGRVGIGDDQARRCLGQRPDLHRGHGAGLGAEACDAHRLGGGGRRYDAWANENIQPLRRTGGGAVGAAELPEAHDSCPPARGATGLIRIPSHCRRLGAAWLGLLRGESDSSSASTREAVFTGERTDTDEIRAPSDDRVTVVAGFRPRGSRATSRGPTLPRSPAVWPDHR